MDRIKKVDLEGVDGLIVDNPLDLYYLTGLELSLGRLLILPGRATLFVDGRYFDACSKKSNIEVQLWDFKTPFPAPANLLLGFDALNTSYAAYQKLAASGGRWKALEGPILQQRMIKEPQEIEKLRRAAQLGTQGFAHVCSLLREGISEQQIATDLEIFWKQNGGRQTAFEPIIAFGAGSAEPHHRAGKKKLLPHETVLIDIGVTLDHYVSDMTRVLFYRNPPAEMKKIYEIVLAAQQTALSLCKAGVQVRELNDAVAAIYAKEGHKMIHGLGHGVGLEVHEGPSLKQGDLALKANMVVTIEPGIYIPGLGGVRIEDTILITDSGYENISKASKEYHALV